MSDLPLSLIVKLGSLVVHCQEDIDSDGSAFRFDLAAIRSLANDQEIQAWLDSLDPALLPVKR